MMERADRFLVPFFLNRVFFFFFILFIVFADVVLIVGAFAGRQEVVTGLEPVERVLRRVGRVELDEERRRRRPKFGVVSDAAQVCNHRRLDVTAVVDFDAVFARQATIDNFEGFIILRHLTLRNATASGRHLPTGEPTICREQLVSFTVRKEKEFVFQEVG